MSYRFAFISLIFTFIITVIPVQSQNPALVGYWQNWNDANCPYIQLTNVDTSYNIIPVAFALPTPGTTYNMQFTPDGVSVQTLIGQIQTMKAAGKKVLISVGGETGHVALNDSNERNIFVSSMMSIITTYGFDGVDIDIEGGSLFITGGTIANPVDAKIINLIHAVKMLMVNFRQQYNKKMMLTIAPETAYVQGGMSAYGGIWGAYLPVIHALRDSIDVLHVQLYNSGSMYGVDGNIYFQGSADFILSQTEAVLYGFSTGGGYFAPLRQDQIAVGLPACSSAAGGGYIHPDTVKAAINYLRGFAPKPANYTRFNSYPELRGMMTWSINWDATANCNSVYEFARNFDRIFYGLVNVTTNENSLPEKFSLNQNYPNPFNPETTISFSIPSVSEVRLTVYDITGKELAVIVNQRLTPGVYEQKWYAANMPSGVYFYTLQSGELNQSKRMLMTK